MAKKTNIVAKPRHEQARMCVVENKFGHRDEPNFVAMVVAAAAAEDGSPLGRSVCLVLMYNDAVFEFGNNNCNVRRQVHNSSL